ncbi:unnamed protein product, partial [Iphiclides podalirius]
MSAVERYRTFFFAPRRVGLPHSAASSVTNSRAMKWKSLVPGSRCRDSGSAVRRCAPIGILNISGAPATLTVKSVRHRVPLPYP